MLKQRIAKFFLKRAIGKFLKDELLLEQLNISFENENGVITMHDVELKTDMWPPFPGLNVVQARVGTLVAYVPWTQMWTENVVFELQGVQVVLSVCESGPKDFPSGQPGAGLSEVSDNFGKLENENENEEEYDSMMGSVLFEGEADSTLSSGLVERVAELKEQEALASEDPGVLEEVFGKMLMNTKAKVSELSVVVRNGSAELCLVVPHIATKHDAQEKVDDYVEKCIVMDEGMALLVDGETVVTVSGVEWELCAFLQQQKKEPMLQTVLGVGDVTVDLNRELVLKLQTWLKVLGVDGERTVGEETFGDSHLSETHSHLSENHLSDDSEDDDAFLDFNEYTTDSWTIASVIHSPMPDKLNQWVHILGKLDLLTVNLWYDADAKSRMSVEVGHCQIESAFKDHANGNVYSHAASIQSLIAQEWLRGKEKSAKKKPVPVFEFCTLTTALDRLMKRNSEDTSEGDTIGHAMTLQMTQREGDDDAKVFVALPSLLWTFDPMTFCRLVAWLPKGKEKDKIVEETQDHRDGKDREKTTRNNEESKGKEPSYECEISCQLFSVLVYTPLDLSCQKSLFSKTVFRPQVLMLQALGLGTKSRVLRTHSKVEKWLLDCDTLSMYYVDDVDVRPVPIFESQMRNADGDMTTLGEITVRHSSGQDGANSDVKGNAHSIEKGNVSPFVSRLVVKDNVTKEGVRAPDDDEAAVYRAKVSEKSPLCVRIFLPFTRVTLTRAQYVALMECAWIHGEMGAAGQETQVPMEQTIQSESEISPLCVWVDFSLVHVQLVDKETSMTLELESGSIFHTGGPTSSFVLLQSRRLVIGQPERGYMGERVFVSPCGQGANDNLIVAVEMKKENFDKCVSCRFSRLVIDYQLGDRWVMEWSAFFAAPESIPVPNTRIETALDIALVDSALFYTPSFSVPMLGVLTCVKTGFSVTLDSEGVDTELDFRCQDWRLWVFPDYNFVPWGRKPFVDFADLEGLHTRLADCGYHDVFVADYCDLLLLFRGDAEKDVDTQNGALAARELVTEDLHAAESVEAPMPRPQVDRVAAIPSKVLLVVRNHLFRVVVAGDSLCVFSDLLGTLGGGGQNKSTRTHVEPTPDPSLAMTISSIRDGQDPKPLTRVQPQAQPQPQGQVAALSGVDVENKIVQEYEPENQKHEEIIMMAPEETDGGAIFDEGFVLVDESSRRKDVDGFKDFQDLYVAPEKPEWSWLTQEWGPVYENYFSVPVVETLLDAVALRQAEHPRSFSLVLEDVALFVTLHQDRHFGTENVKNTKEKRKKKPLVTVCLSGVYAEYDTFTEGDNWHLSARCCQLCVKDHVSPLFPNMVKEDDALFYDPKGSFLAVDWSNVDGEVRAFVDVEPLCLFLDQSTLEELAQWSSVYADCRVGGGPSGGDSGGSTVFFQRFKIQDMQIRVDYRPTSMNYAGLGRGHFQELANLFPIHNLRLSLPSVETNGVAGIEALGDVLVNRYVPHVLNTQLQNVALGLRHVGGLLRVTSAGLDLLWLPIREYQRGGSVWKGVSTSGSHLGKVLFGISDAHDQQGHQGLHQGLLQAWEHLLRESKARGKSVVVVPVQDSDAGGGGGLPVGIRKK